MADSLRIDGNGLEWMPARDAFALVAKCVGEDKAAAAILTRARHGLIAAQAAVLIKAGVRYVDVPIELSFWQYTEDQLSQDWVLGDFSGWHENEERQIWFERCIEVRFSREDVKRMLGIESWRNATSSFRSGVPGRPSAKNLVLTEHARRHAQGEAQVRVSDEARFLSSWLRREHPEAPAIKEKSMENVIRDQHRTFFPIK